jgi:RHS repeat-associated protein
LTGKEDDYELGLTFFGARYYSPFLKRWMSADPLTVHGGAGDLNPYAYVGGRTTTMIDPSGLAAESNGDGNAPAPPPGTSCSGSDCGYDLGRVGRSIADAWDSLFGNRGPTKYGSSSPSATPTKQTVTVPRLVLSLATSYKSFVYESILRTNQGVWDIERQFGVVDLYTGLGGRDYVSDNIRWHLANEGADPNVQAAAQINATGGLAIASMMMPELFLKDLPAMLASGGRGGGGTGGGGMTTLFHGHQAPLVGGQFDLEAATEMQRAGTPEAGVYLTDDVARAATQYAGPGGFVTRTEVPTAVANAMKQASPILGPRGVVQYEWVARTPGEVNMLNQSLQTLPQIQALRAWLGNL